MQNTHANTGVSADKDANALHANQKLNESAQRAGHINPGEGLERQREQLSQEAHNHQDQQGQQYQQQQYQQGQQDQQYQQQQGQQYQQGQQNIDRQQQFNQQDQQRFGQQAQQGQQGYQAQNQQYDRQQLDQEIKQQDRERGGDDTQFKNSLRQDLERAPHQSELNTDIGKDRDYKADNSYGVAADKNAASLQHNQLRNEHAQKEGHINPGEGLDRQSQQLADHARQH